MEEEKREEGRKEGRREGPAKSVKPRARKVVIKYAPEFS